MKVRLFYKDNCLYCKLIETFFKKHNIEFEMILCDRPGVPFIKIDNVLVKGPYSTRRLKRIFHVVR